ncbi:MAG TPA: HDIG domain-containing protein [Thermoanaerobaculia bacterium]|jgi:hypothetical protein
MGQSRSQGSSRPQATSRTQGPSRPQGTGRRATRTAALRRPPEKGLARVKHRIRTTWEHGLELWQVWTLAFLFLAGWCLLPSGLFQPSRVEAGAIATRTWVADRDLSVINPTATEELRRQAAAAVLPVYDFNRGVETERLRQLGALFVAGRRLLQPRAKDDEEPRPGDEADVDLAPDLIQALTEASGLKLAPEEVEWLRLRGFSVELEDRLAGVIRRVLRLGVVSDKALLLEHRATGITVRELPAGPERVQLDLYRYLDYRDQLRETVEQELRTWDGLAGRDRQLLTAFVLANVTPNLTLNSSETLGRRKAAADAVGSLSHPTRKGEVIVRKGELVEDLAARTIAEMAGPRDRLRPWLTGAGTLLLLTAAMAFLWLGSGLESRRDRSRVRLFNELLIVLAVHALGVSFAFFVATALAGAIQSSPWSSLASYTYAVPFASLALLCVLLYGRNVAFFLTLVFALLVGRIAGGEAQWTMTFYSLVSSLAAVFAFDHHHFKQRSVMIRAAWVIALANAAAVVTLKSLTGDVAGGMPQLGFDLLCALAGAFLAASVVSFSVPIFEALYSITTYIKLLELSNTNLPLLRRLALEAPGTFQHSIAVANLAKAGCEAIGLDSVLVHTAALYHDIGKVFRPHYFVENQVPGQNPHDKIQPSMSALILINHVKEGLDLARKHHLPQPIFDAIEQHHGTHLIKFFYNRARERSDPETEEVREDDFRYSGPKPQSKEMGILMLADGVEAASRTLVEPSRQKIRGLLRQLFDSSLQDHQLDQTDLTLGDLGRVEEAFLKVLTNIYHRRVDYPGFDFNQPGNAPGKAKGSGKITAKADAEDSRSRDGRTLELARPALRDASRDAELGQRKAS